MKFNTGTFIHFPIAGDDVGSRALPSTSAADAGEGGVGSRGAGEDMLVELA